MARLEDMTPEQLREWEAAGIEKLRRAFAGQPMPEVSRVEAADYPHQQRSGWGIPLVADAALQLWRPRAGEPEAGTVLGLRTVDDPGPLALLIRACDGTQEWLLHAPVVE